MEIPIHSLLYRRILFQRINSPFRTIYEGKVEEVSPTGDFLRMIVGLDISWYAKDKITILEVLD